MTLLVRTPVPHQTESLLGYVLRVSEENGYDSPWHVLKYAGIAQGQMCTAGLPIDNLAAVLGVDEKTLAHISYKVISQTGQHFKILNHRLGQGLNEGPFRLKHPAFCPRCAAEHGYIDAFWDLAVAVACPYHGSLVLKACPDCNSSISWFRPGLLKCKCGATFEKSNTSQGGQGLRALMNVFHKKLHDLPVTDMENLFSFPLQQLDKMPFNSLIQITRSLGRWNITSHSLTEQDDEHVLSATVNTLQDWPTGFHGMLGRLGDIALKNGVKGAGLRKQFDTFYSSMFKGRDFAPDAEFLRDEFIEFGKLHWGQALVDAKLLKSQGKENSNTARFVSKTFFAKHYGLWKPTLDRLIRSGVISTKRIKTGKSERILVDIEKSILPVESQGMVSIREAAHRAGLPVRVLQFARKVGIYTTKVRSRGSEIAWHQDDVDEFIQQGQNLVQLPIIGAAGVSIKKAMQLHLFGKDAKADIICAIFEGKLKVIGSDGTNFAGLLLDTCELADFARRKRGSSFNGTYSASNVYKEIGLDPMVVSKAVAESLLEMEIVHSQKRITQRSVDSFNYKYIVLAKLANELGTSAKTLLRCCLNAGIPVINLEKKNTAYKHSILLRTEEVRLRAVWANQIDHQTTKKQKSLPHGEAKQVALFREYLTGLTQRNETLPRLAGKPNMVQIAKAAGFGRDMFYAYAPLVAMLNIHDALERHCDKDIPLDPLAKIQRYLSILRENNMTLPKGYGGKPNLVLISKACGCQRNIFYTNRDAQRILNEYVSARELADKSHKVC